MICPNVSVKLRRFATISSSLSLKMELVSDLRGLRIVGKMTLGVSVIFNLLLQMGCSRSVLALFRAFARTCCLCLFISFDSDNIIFLDDR